MCRPPRDSGRGACGLAGVCIPEQLVNADFVQITDVHLDVPLYWQSWKMDSVLVGTVGAAVLDAPPRFGSA